MQLSIIVIALKMKYENRNAIRKFVSLLYVLVTDLVEDTYAEGQIILKSCRCQTWRRPDEYTRIFDFISRSGKYWES